MKSYVLPEGLRDALLNYLRGQPYGEVAQGMKALEALEEIKESSPKLESVKEG